MKKIFPEKHFWCKKLHGDLSYDTCVKRHLRLTGLHSVEREVPRYPECASCPLGAKHLVRLETLGWHVPTIQERRRGAKLKTQWKARTRWFQEHLIFHVRPG